MEIEEILNYLDAHEIDFRLESNHCCGYVFYFLDGSVYPRRYYDYELEGEKETVEMETVDHQIHRALGRELTKDWRHRIEAESLSKLFEEVEQYIFRNTNQLPK